jgi:hypothetical protein
MKQLPSIVTVFTNVQMHVWLIYVNKTAKIKLNRSSAFFGIRMKAVHT